jgi:hypothetical protein
MEYGLLTAWARLTAEPPITTTILLFDHDDHSAVPTCARPRCRAQRRSRMPRRASPQAARSVLDGREHDGILIAETGAEPSRSLDQPVNGRYPTRMNRPPDARGSSPPLTTLPCAGIGMR